MKNKTKNKKPIKGGAKSKAKKLISKPKRRKNRNLA